jgi:hypothetical protein
MARRSGSATRRGKGRRKAEARLRDKRTEKQREHAQRRRKVSK